MEDKADAPKASDGLLSAEDLVSMFESSEDATVTARQNAERDRDYVDNVQLTPEEIAALEKRKQPPIIINRIKRKVDFLKGYEQSQRIDPRALPRTPAHEEDANAVEQALRYVSDDQNMDFKRSAAWDNLIVEGMAGYRVGVKQGYDGVEIQIDRIPWDRMFYDPHSSAGDFSDAGFLGVVRWVDYDEAVAQYPDGADILEACLSSTQISDTYDDKPKFRVWADRKRRRVRICQIWVKRQEQWYWAEFTKGGILKSGPSPYHTDKGESDCELIFGSAYVNRENERYGLVREMIGPQDEINKRRSKALHLLNTSQIVAEDGAVQDVELARREAARPDGFIKLNPGGTDKFKFETRVDLATGHLQMLQEAKNEIDMMAGNIALQGNALQKSAASGKAIIASQQGGAMEIAPLMDALRHMDIRVFRAVWARIRQFWTAEKWVRVTDDERNIKWLGLNVDPMKLQMLQMQNPEAAQKIAGAVGNLAELDCDIIIDDTPDGLTPQLEQFQSLVELKKMDAMNELPFRAILMAMPNLKNKEQVLAAMDQAQQAAAQAAPQPNPLELKAQEIQLQAEMKMKELQVNAELKREEMIMDQRLQQEKMAADHEMQRQKMASDMEMERERCDAQTQMGLHKMKVESDTRRELAKQEADPTGEIGQVVQAVETLAQNVEALQTVVEDIADEISAESQIIRDETGRPAGVRKIRKSGRSSDMAIVRDEQTGSIIGARRAPQPNEAA